MKKINYRHIMEFLDQIREYQGKDTTTFGKNVQKDLTICANRIYVEKGSAESNEWRYEQ